jgi:hypothetical protein
MPLTLLDPGVSGSVAPNRVRDVLATGPNASNGTMTIRRTVTNNTGAAVTRLRFRITDITTFNSNGAGIPLCAGAQCADLRALTSPGPTVVTITGPNPACPGNTCTVQATTLEEAAVPNNQPNGGGFNSSLSAGTVNLASQLAPGQSINVQFLLGVNTPGNFRFFLDVEVLP